MSDSPYIKGFVATKKIKQRGKNGQQLTGNIGKSFYSEERREDKRASFKLGEADLNRLQQAGTKQTVHSLKRSFLCGCYFCCHIQPSRNLFFRAFFRKENEEKVSCPDCSKDTVITDRDFANLSEKTLRALYQRFFY